MRYVLRGLGVVVVAGLLSLASPAEATGRLTEQQCKQLLDRVYTYLAEYERDDDDDWRDDRRRVRHVRHAIVSRYYWRVLHRVKWCIKTYYGDPQSHYSPGHRAMDHQRMNRGELWAHLRDD